MSEHSTKPSYDDASTEALHQFSYDNQTPPSDTISLAASHPLDQDIDDERTRYLQELDAILNTPLRPENYQHYTEDALSKLINLSESVLHRFKGPSLPITPGISGTGAAENYVTNLYGRPIGAVLDSVVEKNQVIKSINNRVQTLKNASEIFLPTDQTRDPIVKNGGDLKAAEVVPKLETVLFYLKEGMGLDLDNDKEVRITRGNVTPEMMRQEPYYLVELPGLNRALLICNEKGNITYVMDSSKFEQAHTNPSLLVNGTKEEINGLLQNIPGLGARIVHTSKYIPKIEEALNSISAYNQQGEQLIDNDANITEQSMLTEQTPKAPEGYMRVREIAKDFSVGRTTIYKIITELGDALGESIQAKNGSNVYSAFSPEQVEMIRQRAEAKGLFAPKDDNYKSVRQIAKDFSKDRATINTIIAELGDALGAPILSRAGSMPANTYSREQVEMIRQALERQRGSKPTK